MRYRVVVSSQASRRVRAQAAYIAGEGGSPQNAEEWLARIDAAIASLETLPRRCPLAIENQFREIELSLLVVDGYMLIFSIEDDTRTVTIAHARHGRQQPDEPTA